MFWSPSNRCKSFVEFQAQILKQRQVFFALQVLSGCLLSIVISLCLLWLALTLEPERKNSALILSLFLCTSLIWWFWPQLTRHNPKWSFLLDVRDPELSVSPYQLDYPEVWPQIAEHLRQIIKPWHGRLLRHLYQRIVAILGFSLILFVAEFSHASLTQLNIGIDFRFWSPLLKPTDTLMILKGFTGDTAPKFSLDPESPAVLELEKTNLVEVALGTRKYRRQTNATLELREMAFSTGKGEVSTHVERKNLSLYQSFQLVLNDASTASAQISEEMVKLVFSVGSNTALFIPELYGDKALAIFSLKILPLPKVSLELLSPRKDPWPDHRPLKLKILVEAFYPLSKVELLIKAGKKQNKELVSDILVDNMRSYNTEYELFLEPYVISDIENIEIIATATDLAIPAPLTGYSNSIALNVASAYGRYRNTLQTLRDVKSSLDQNIATQKPMIDERAIENMNKSLEDADDSPFFDNFDRIRLNEMKSALERQLDKPHMEQLYILSNELNTFLLEHESLDDRERDRDFFVAARGLARALEIPENKRNTSIEEITLMMKKFVQERHNRWGQRVARLPKNMVPAMWQDKIMGNPFLASLDQIKQLKEKEEIPSKNEQAMMELSRSVNDYRAWIEALERQEDLHRAEMEQAKEQALVSAQNEIENIRKLQARISLALDQAAIKDKEKLEALWPDIRMDQNANIKNTQKLESDLRSFSPSATARLKAAISEMKTTNEKGNEGDFVSSESHADMAGRLLIQAQNAAQRERSRMGQGRQSHKRTTGDNSYGNEIISSQDVETHYGYQVDKIYREEVIEETQNAEGWEDNKSFLSDYLRQIVR